MPIAQIRGSVVGMTKHGHSHQGHFDAERVAAALEVEGQLASGLAAEAITLCADRFADQGRTVERIVDIGSGPGVDTAQLAERFPSATVVAADGSTAMLARAEARAKRLGLADRVETCAVDLDGDLQIAGSCDLAWSAMAIHHAEDEVATLSRIRELLRPQGLVCLLERAGPMSVRLADDLGRPGIWERLEEARSAWSAGARPTLPGARNAERYPSMLASAGLDIVASRTLTDTVTAAADPATRKFLAAQLRATARNLADVADAADIEALLAIVDGSREARWDGVTVTSSRELFIAQLSGVSRST
ncbi:MAG TPA: methyltransferase domain-containing protein [Solirubrobacteraceae bacterium]|nr:methyltransferase domain-containing protein [Solirubrobacteraceae bacterium]